MADVPPFAHRAAAQLDSQSLDIVVMGPGRLSPGGDKRTAIFDYITNLGCGDAVLRPETALSEVEALNDLDEHSAERLLVANADVIIVLLVEDLSVTGPETELSQFLPQRHLRDKFFVIEPRSYTELIQSGSPYQLSALRDFDSRRRFSYTPDQLQSCTAIRDRIRAWLRGMRYEKLIRADAI